MRTIDVHAHKDDGADASRCSVAVFSLADQARRLLDEMFVAPGSPFVFAWAADSVAELMRLTSSAEPDLLMLDEASLGDRAPFVLGGLHAIAPRVRSILAGEPADAQMIGRLIEFGLRGILTHARFEIDLRRALEALMRHQMWFSRQRMTELLRGRMSVAATGRSETLDKRFRELTEREFMVMQRILRGSTNKDIARSLEITEHTVKIHVQNIFRKLRVRRRIDLLLLHKTAG